MSPLKAIPFEDLEIEKIAVLADFINPLMFPFKKDKKGMQILYVGTNDRVYETLDAQFPEAILQRIDVVDPLTGGKDPAHETFDYIVAVSIGKTGGDVFSKISRLAKGLKPGGVMACGVNGYAGYYGLEMLGTIIKYMASDIDDITAPNNISKIKKLIQTVVERLPEDHPSFHCRLFMERLKQGDMETIKQLLGISRENIFTVTQLLASIRERGNRLLDWIVPAFYNPGRFVGHEESAKQLEGLQVPEQWQVAELVNATPPEHYFFLGKENMQPVTLPWHSDDIFWWSPVRLPLYQWENLATLAAEGGELKPITDCDALGNVELKSWQAGLCREADGKETLNNISIKSKRSSDEIVRFLKKAVELRLLALLPPGCN